MPVPQRLWIFLGNAIAEAEASFLSSAALIAFDVLGNAVHDNIADRSDLPDSARSIVASHEDYNNLFLEAYHQWSALVANRPNVY